MQPISIVVTEPQYAKAAAVFDAADGVRLTVAPPGEAALAAAIRRVGAQGVILGVEPYAGSLYEALPPGGVISRFGVGHDGIDKIMATAAGIAVTNTPGVLEDAVAEHALTLILAIVRDIPRLAAAMKAGRWSPALAPELRGKRLAIVGCGAIGGRTARAASLALGMRVTAVVRDCARAAELKARWQVADVTDDLDAALAAADVVSLHLPATSETRHLIACRTLGVMKPGAFLVNTARGSVVDENAVFDALEGGRLAGAALDVFEREPYVPIDPARDLCTLPNVLLTPHVGSATVEACARMAALAVENIRCVVSGRAAEAHIVNPAVRDRLPGLGTGGVQGQ